MHEYSFVLIEKLFRKAINFLYLICFWLLLIFIKFLTLLFKTSKIATFNNKHLRGRPSILFLESIYPNNAGYYYRSQLWVENLRNENFKVKITFVFDEKLHGELHSGKIIQPIYHFIFILRQIVNCLNAFNYNLVIVRRELLLFNDYGNLFLEKFLISINNHVILDFDDDISASKNEPRKIGLYGKLMLEHSKKFQSSLQLYKYFIAGSNYLKERVIQYSPTTCINNINVIPTCVNYEHYSLKEYDPIKENIDLGWIGNSGNFIYLDEIMDALDFLSRKYKIRLLIISDCSYDRTSNFEIINIPWSLNSEIEMFHKIDIGLMPLIDSAIARGKCGFKLIQYMGCGLVSVSSAVTVNNEIVNDEVNGFLVYDKKDWGKTLIKVVERRAQFQEIGQKAFDKVLANYSFEANKNKYVEFLIDIINGKI